MVKLLSNNVIGCTLSSICRGFKMSRSSVMVVRTRFVYNFLTFLYNKGFIFGFEVSGSHHYLVHLKYWRGQPLFSRFEIISKGSSRVFLTSKQVKQLRQRSICIFSTAEGIKTGVECVNLNIGGEFLCKLD